MARRLLWASLAIAPITILLDAVVHPSKVVLFLLAAVSLVPLAWLIGEATEHAGEHTGPRIGGLLNASFGNAPELIIALVAIGDSLPNVVRGSLAGSVVSNSMDPPWILLRDLEEQELLPRLDAVVFSSDVGVRKPRREIFERALADLDVAPDRALFVGDRLDADVRGARDVGMQTAQAMWFRAEEDTDVQPDFQAFTQVDVLNIVRRLTGEL